MLWFVYTLILAKTLLSSVQSFSGVRLFVTPWTAARQASLSLTSPRVYRSSRSLPWWWHPAISSSDALFSFGPLSFPTSGTFSMSLFASDNQNTGASASASVLPVNIQGLFPLRLTGLISLRSRECSEVFSSTTVQRHQFFGVLPLRSSSHNAMWPLGRPCLDYMDLCRQSNVSAFQHTV